MQGDRQLTAGRTVQTSKQLLANIIALQGPSCSTQNVDHFVHCSSGAPAGPVGPLPEKQHAHLPFKSSTETAAAATSCKDEFEASRPHVALANARYRHALSWCEVRQAHAGPAACLRLLQMNPMSRWTSKQIRIQTPTVASCADAQSALFGRRASSPPALQCCVAGNLLHSIVSPERLCWETGFNEQGRSLSNRSEQDKPCASLVEDSCSSVHSAQMSCGSTRHTLVLPAHPIFPANLSRHSSLPSSTGYFVGDSATSLQHKGPDLCTTPPSLPCEDHARPASLNACTVAANESAQRAEGLPRSSSKSWKVATVQGTPSTPLSAPYAQALQRHSRASLKSRSSSLRGGQRPSIFQSHAFHAEMPNGQTHTSCQLLEAGRPASSAPASLHNTLRSNIGSRRTLFQRLWTGKKSEQGLAMRSQSLPIKAGTPFQPRLVASHLSADNLRTEVRPLNQPRVYLFHAIHLRCCCEAIILYGT